MGFVAAIPAMWMMIGSMAISAVSAFAQMDQAKKSAKATEQAAAATLALRNKEIDREKGEVDRIAGEDRSDIIRRADSELGAIRVAAGEVGATNGEFVRMVQELGYVEGLDLSRNEANRVGRRNALEGARESATQDYLNIKTQAYNQKKAATTNAILGFAGSALQIGAAYNRQERLEEIYRNRTPPKGP